MGRNIDVLAGVVCFIQRYTPPLKVGEIYLAIFQVITIVFIIIALGSQFIKSVVSDRRAEYNDRIF